MRLSSLVVASILLFSITAFAQHTSSSSTPSSPPPAPAHSSPAPAPSPPPSVSSSASSASSVTHSSAPSSPSPTSSPSAASPAASNHSSAGATQVPGSTAAPTSREPMASHPAAHPPESEAVRAIPERKLPGDDSKIAPAQRIGGAPEDEPKPAEPDLRRRICADGPCKETPPQPTTGQPDLRRRICKNGPCVECPPGQSAGKNGTCAGTPTQNPAQNQCAPNGTWNGVSCVATDLCAPTEYWNGFQCVARSNDCASIDARAAMLANEIRGTHAQMQQACSSNPSGKECSELKQSYDGAILRYRMLMNEAPVGCRTSLPDPLSL